MADDGHESDDDASALDVRTSATRMTRTPGNVAPSAISIRITSDRYSAYRARSSDYDHARYYIYIPDE